MGKFRHLLSSIPRERGMGKFVICYRLFSGVGVWVILVICCRRSSGGRVWLSSLSVIVYSAGAGYG